MLSIALLAVAAQQLKPLIGPCDHDPTNHISCDSDFYKPVWMTLKSETGELIKIDTASVELAGIKGADVFVYITPPHSYLEMRRLRHLFFNCEGEFSDMNSIGDMMDAPPNSVAGMIAGYVCPIAARLNRERIAKARRD